MGFVTFQVRRSANFLAAKADLPYRDSPSPTAYTPKNEHPAAPRQGTEPLRKTLYFQPIRPAKPRQPPTTSIQSGLSLVTGASPAAPIVTSAATTVWSEVRARINPL